MFYELRDISKQTNAYKLAAKKSKSTATLVTSKGCYFPFWPMHKNTTTIELNSKNEILS